MDEKTLNNLEKTQREILTASRRLLRIIRKDSSITIGDGVHDTYHHLIDAYFAIEHYLNENDK